MRSFLERLSGPGGRLPSSGDVKPGPTFSTSAGGGSTFSTNTSSGGGYTINTGSVATGRCPSGDVINAGQLCPRDPGYFITATGSTSYDASLIPPLPHELPSPTSSSGDRGYAREPIPQTDMQVLPPYPTSLPDASVPGRGGWRKYVPWAIAGATAIGGLTFLLIRLRRR